MAGTSIMQLTPDGQRYAAMARGIRVPAPFHYRWLLPFLCGDWVRRWTVQAAVAMLSLPVLLGLWGWERGLGWEASVAAGLMVVGLAGVWSVGWRWPVLVDGAAMAVGLGAVVAGHVWWPAGIVLVLVAGSIKETSPVFVAAWAWNPWLLTGLVAPLLRRLVSKPGVEDPVGPSRSGETGAREALERPWHSAWEYHLPQWTDWQMMVAPWGAALVALGALDVRLAVVLALAYGQLLVATDTVRLYQWAAPVMLVVAVGLVPVWALPFLVVGTLWNPWKGDGI